MAKVQGPLLSLGATGAIGKTMVFDKWKGRDYVRRYAIPANPNTPEQLLTRNTFAWCSEVWRRFPPLAVAPWDRFVNRMVLTARSAFIGKNIATLRTETTLARFIASPGTGGGFPPIRLTLMVPFAAGELLATPIPPTTEWTIQMAVAVAIPDQNPQTGILYGTTANYDLTYFYDIELTGLLSGQLYYVFAWFQYLRPDGQIAYGPSIPASATTV